MANQYETYFISGRLWSVEQIMEYTDVSYANIRSRLTRYAGTNEDYKILQKGSMRRGKTPTSNGTNIPDKYSVCTQHNCPACEYAWCVMERIKELKDEEEEYTQDNHHFSRLNNRLVIRYKQIKGER